MSAKKPPTIAESAADAYASARPARPLEMHQPPIAAPSTPLNTAVLRQSLDAISRDLARCHGLERASALVAQAALEVAWHETRSPFAQAVFARQMRRKPKSTGH